MKWPPFLILAVIALVCQTTVAPALAIHAIWPDWMFILAVYYALWAPWPEAAIAAWCLGLLFGTQTLDPLGLHAFCYGAAAWGIVRVRQVVFREHAITQFAVTLLFAMGVQLAVATFRWWRNAHEPSWIEGLTPAFFTALYTAAVAPFLHWALLHTGWTGLRTGKKAGYRR